MANSDFDNTVFGDTDDFFAPNRIELSKQLLQQHAIIAHDVWLVNELGQLLEPNYWKYRPELLQGISYKNLVHYNVLGLGNTAIQNKVLPKEFKIPADLIAVDWYVFSNLLKEGIRAFFTAETYIYYRQYEGNTIGLKKLTFLNIDLARFLTSKKSSPIKSLEINTPLGLRVSFEKLMTSEHN